MGARVEQYLTIIDEKPRSYRVSNGRVAPWLAKSVVSVNRFRGPNHPHAIVSIPVWLAKKTGLLRAR